MNPFQRSERHHSERGHASARRGFSKSIFGKDNNRVAGGHRAVLSNRKTSRRGRKQEHRMMGKLGDGGTYLPFMSKVKRALGMHDTPHKKRQFSNKQKRRSALV